MLREQHIWRAKHFLDIFLTDFSQKMLVLPPRRHAGTANNARTSHFSRMFASIAVTDFQRQLRADDCLQHDWDAWTGQWVPCLLTGASVRG